MDTEKYVIMVSFEDGSKTVVSEVNGTKEVAVAEYNKIVFPQWGKTYSNKSEDWKIAYLLNLEGEEILRDKVCKYSLKEYPNKSILYDLEGKELVSFICEQPCVLHTIFHTHAIKILTGDNLTNRHDIYFECDTKETLIKCKERFIELTTNGYACPLREYIGMDMRDLVEASTQFNRGKYYHADAKDPKEVKCILESIKRRIDSYTNNYNAIICLDGNVGLYDSFEGFKPFKSLNCHDTAVFQVLFDENAKNISVDVWTLEK